MIQGLGAEYLSPKKVDLLKGLGFRVLGFRGLGFRVSGLGFRDYNRS